MARKTHQVVVQESVTYSFEIDAEEGASFDRLQVIAYNHWLQEGNALTDCVSVDERSFDFPNLGMPPFDDAEAIELTEELQNGSSTA